MKKIRYKNSQKEVSKIVCIGRNSVEHIEELGNEIPSSMVVFNKPNSALSDKLYYFSEHCRFEGEICFLIKDKKIIAVGFGLDLTHADIQNQLKAKGLPWERAKAFDNSAVLSEFVPICEDITTLNMKLTINDIKVQYASYELMMYKPDTMLKEIESFISLDDYDVIMSGTPKGVATYKRGDIFRGEVYSGDRLLIEESWVVE